ncbi:hypothetical protein EZS27_019516 [termite gut metagenome]|uniref:Uncharacterized protein n=1 Tax=termite gut metagenome TaxID=433724 RepID=A0A5J4RGB3_9ZZZZ
MEKLSPSNKEISDFSGGAKFRNEDTFFEKKLFVWKTELHPKSWTITINLTVKVKTSSDSGRFYYERDVGFSKS